MWAAGGSLVLLNRRKQYNITLHHVGLILNQSLSSQMSTDRRLVSFVAYIVMAYVGMAYTVMAYVGMAYTAMASSYGLCR